MNKIVLISGATSGYGLATAIKFKENGDTVIIASRNAHKVSAAAEEYGFDDGYTIDVRNYEEWTRLAEYIKEKYGHLDVLVNNAGGGVRIADVTEQTKEEIDTAVLLNLNSVIYSSSVLGKIMREQGSGTIINISSVCAKHCWGGWSVYAAAKAGVLNFTKGLYVEMRPFGVRASCVIPAAASTGFQSSAGIGEENQTLTAENVADAVLYVANQPEGVVIEELTVWGTSQDVQPL